MRIEASLTDYRRLLAWAKRWPQRKWAVENANGLGRHLAQWLIARGESVVDVPAAATNRVRELSRGGRRKNDQIDAAAAATVACLQGDGRDVEPEDHTTALALLDERRVNLAQARVRTVNQLHALLRDLLPGGAPTQLSADLAAKLLRSVRPAGDVETVRKDIAWDLVAEIRRLDKQLTDNVARMQSLVEASGSALMDTPGIGVMAARLIGRTRQAHRFPTSAAFANYAGAAPVEIASADKARHRLPGSLRVVDSSGWSGDSEGWRGPLMGRGRCSDGLRAGLSARRTDRSNSALLDHLSGGRHGSGAGGGGVLLRRFLEVGDGGAIPLRPVGQGGDGFGEGLTEVGEAVFDPWGHLGIGMAFDQAVALKSAQCLGEDLAGDATDPVDEFTVPTGPATEGEQDHDGPFVGDDVDGEPGVAVGEEDASG